MEQKTLKPTGGIEFALFRLADAQADQAKAFDRLVTELAAWRELLTAALEKKTA